MSSEWVNDRKTEDASVPVSSYDEYMVAQFQKVGETAVMVFL